jgi:hypothetical protein
MGILRTSTHGRRPAEKLRRAIDCLPVASRVAMLEAIREETIVTGAYSTRDGGVCPMLGAHRHGGRTSLASFARAWDRYTGARRARRATPRELRVLEGMLEASLALEHRAELDAAWAEHQALMRGRFEREAKETGGWPRTLEDSAPEPAAPAPSAPTPEQTEPLVPS